MVDYPGGFGGYNSEQPSQPLFNNRIFFGGGGGGSTSLTGLTPAAGNGGGIVIIVSDTIIGNGGNILADGGNGGASISSGGSGGGGGGGSIALHVKSYGATPLVFSVKGGKGGDNPNPYGEGGGGGGGFIYVSNDVAPGSSKLDGGLAGNYFSPSSSDGSVGEKRVGFEAVLNGFLFNSIRSSVTGIQIDTVCSDTKPPKISGTTPIGGSGTYTYLWEKSYNQVTWITLINDPDPTNYTPIIEEPATVWFRRTVSDGTLTDYGKPVQFIVQQKIQNNTIVTTPDVLCFNGEPQLLMQGIPDLIPSVSNTKYIWESSNDNIVWTNLNAPENAKEFDPAGGLTADTWYRRTVVSGRCVE